MGSEIVEIDLCSEVEGSNKMISPFPLPIHRSVAGR